MADLIIKDGEITYDLTGLTGPEIGAILRFAGIARAATNPLTDVYDRLCGEALVAAEANKLPVMSAETGCGCATLLSIIWRDE